MRISLWLSSVLAGTLIAGCTGCLFTRHSTNVIRKNEKLAIVQYESQQAENVFTAAVADKRKYKSLSNPKVTAIPFVLWYSRVDELSDNAVFNDAAAACDADGDRVISLAEALRFQSKVEIEVAAREQRHREANAVAEVKPGERRGRPAAKPADAQAWMPPSSVPAQAQQPGPNATSAAGYQASYAPNGTPQ
jgi:hypothetical protein